MTSFQFFAHFRRHAKDKSQVAHVFVGSSDFLIIFGIDASLLVKSVTSNAFSNPFTVIQFLQER